MNVGRTSDARRVLVVEDEADLREVLTYNLEQGGYQVMGADRGRVALEKFETFRPDLVLLDLMLPDLSGTEICRRIRARTDRPQPAIVMLTAKGDEIDRVVGFEVGADDYVAKPFSMRELLLRVNAMFKRLGGAAASGAAPAEAGGNPAGGSAHEHRRLVAGPLQIDVDGHHLYIGGEEVHVSILEMRLLVYLLESRGHVRSRQQLLSDVWGYKPGVSTRTVDTHVKRLRDKLGPAGDLIETVRGLGYRFGDAG